MASARSASAGPHGYRARTLEATPTDTGSPKAGVGARSGAVIGALVLAFLAAVAVLVMVQVGDTATCDDVLAGKADFNDDGECYDGSSTTKLIALVLGWPGAVLAVVATFLALAFAIRGRGGRRLVQVIVAAAVLLGLSLLIG